MVSGDILDCLFAWCVAGQSTGTVGGESEGPGDAT